MGSNFAAVGLDAAHHDEMATWIDSMLGEATSIGKRRNVDVLRWEDPSGARVTFEVRNREIENLLPSFAGRWLTQLAGIRRLSSDVARANVIDDAGEQLTAMTLELEERALIDERLQHADAAIVALGRDVHAFEDADTFAASDQSYLGDPAEAGDPPESATASGIIWPPRVGAESFVSTGIFESAKRATADATLHGTVVSAEMRRNTLTGQPFHVLRLTGLFETDLCVAGSDVPGDIRPNMVVGGDVFMVASLHSWIPAPAESWWRRFSIRG